MSGDPRVSVVIPTAGGRASILQRTLCTVLDDAATGEVIIVLDRVDSPTEAVVSKASREDPRVVAVSGGAAEVSLDRGQANRTAGVRAARGDLIVALDDDVEPGPGLVTGHSRRHAGTDGLLVLGYMPLAPVGRRRGAVRMTARFYGEVYERQCRTYECAPESILLQLWAGNLSLSRKAWLDATASEMPGAYHVDREFGLRLRALGIRAAFDRRLRAVHHYRRTAARFFDDALSSGIGHAAIRAAHPELNEFDPPLVPDSGPRSLLWRGRSRSRACAAARCLALAAEGAAIAHVSDLEFALVRAVWTVGFGRGLYEATRSL